jgi:hypothetical protein
MYRLHRRLNKRLYILTLAFGLLLFETGLLMHEVEHHLTKSPDKDCILCDAANQIGNAHLAPSPPTITSSTINELPIAIKKSIYSQQITIAYSSRAPPLISSV